MKKYSFILILLTTAIGSFAQNDYDFFVMSNYVNIYYKITNSDPTNRTVELAKPKEKYIRPVTISQTVTYNGKKYKITGIGDYAFAYCEGITNITIPENITYIGKSAFTRTSLKEISIPESVTSIDDNAFCYNNDLEYVSFPKSVTEVGEAIFYYCPKLNQSISNEHVFVHYNQSDSTINVPEGVHGIFCHQESTPSIKHVILPTTTDTIGQYSIVGGNIKTITVKATTPPHCHDNAISPLELTSTATVYVSDSDPAILERYKADPYWSNFNIVATDLSGDSQDVLADVNRDNTVNASDIVSLYNYINIGEESGVTKQQADVNTDNTVNAADVVAVYNYIATGK